MNSNDKPLQHPQRIAYINIFISLRFDVPISLFVCESCICIRSESAISLDSSAIHSFNQQTKTTHPNVTHHTMRTSTLIIVAVLAIACLSFVAADSARDKVAKVSQTGL